MKKKLPNETIIKRVNASSQIKRLLSAYSVGRNSANLGNDSPPPNVALVVGAGLSGKTTFLNYDVRPLVEQGFGRHSPSFAWVYLSCDSDPESTTPASLFFDLCDQLEKAGLSLPTCKDVLKTYNERASGDLCRLFGKRWSACIEHPSLLEVSALVVNDIVLAANFGILALSNFDSNLVPICIAFQAIASGVSAVKDGVIDNIDF